MGITTTYQQPLWDVMFKAAGLTFAQGCKVQKECVKTCVLALHHLLNARLSRLEALRMKGALLMPKSGKHGVNPIPPAGIG